MNIVRGFNRLIAFLLELVLVIALCYGGYSVAGNVYLKYTLALLLPVIAIVCWSIYAAPRSNKRLEQPWRMAFRLSLYFISAMLLYTIGKTTIAASLATIVLVNELIAFYFKD